MNLRWPAPRCPQLAWQNVGLLRSERPDSLLLLVTLKLKTEKKEKNQLYKMDLLETLKSTLEWALCSSPAASLVSKESACWEARVRSLRHEDSLEKEMAAHSSILAWKIPWTQEPGGLQPMGSQRVGVDWRINTGSNPSRVSLLSPTSN